MKVIPSAGAQTAELSHPRRSKKTSGRTAELCGPKSAPALSQQAERGRTTTGQLDTQLARRSNDQPIDQPPALAPSRALPATSADGVKGAAVAALTACNLEPHAILPVSRMLDLAAPNSHLLFSPALAHATTGPKSTSACQTTTRATVARCATFPRGFVCIVDHIFPSKFYFDHYLTGARADQFLLADFICDQLIKNPSPTERKIIEGVTSSITLNWFISLFHGAVPTQVSLVSKAFYCYYFYV